MNSICLPLVVLFLVCVTSLSSRAAEQAWVTKSNANAKLLLELDARYFPESASRVGVDGFDEEISDLSRDLYEARQSDLRALVAEYQKRLAAEADAKVKQDLEILIQATQDRIQSGTLARKIFHSVHRPERDHFWRGKDHARSAHSTGTTENTVGSTR